MYQQLITSQISRHVIAAAVCLVCLAAGTVEAGLLTPTDVAADTTYSAAFDASFLIDNSGLSSPDLSGVHAVSSGSALNSWLPSNDTLPQLVTFDLGGMYNLTDVHIWNYALNSAFNQSEDITVSFSTTGVGGTFSGAQDISLLDDSGTTVAQTFGLGGVTANAVKFEITSVYLSSPLSFAALSEVKFSAASPEPSTFLLAALGLLGLASARRRHRRK